MRYRPRPILTRAESQELRLRRMKVMQDNMTPEDIGALMRKTIGEALDRNGTVSREDLLQANVPAHAIDTRFRAILLEVVQERADGGINA